MRGYRRKYMISWTCQGATGREFWIMERAGKVSSADIRRMEEEIAKKWSMPGPVIITHVDLMN